MQWFLDLLAELGIECQVGDAAKIRAAEPRKQKHDRRDAELILKLLVEKRFPAIWMPSKELLDLRALLHRHQWVRLRTQAQNALQVIALANGLRPVEVGFSTDFISLLTGFESRFVLTFFPNSRYTRATRHSCRHRRSRREGGDPVRYGLR